MATLQIIGDNEVILLKVDTLSIGRCKSNDLVINDTTVSAQHAQIEVIEKDGKVIHVLQDLSSTNHTYVNNTEIINHRLHDGDIIRVGNTRIKFSLLDQVVEKAHQEKTQRINFNHLWTVW